MATGTVDETIRLKPRGLTMNDIHAGNPQFEKMDHDKEMEALLDSGGVQDEILKVIAACNTEEIASIEN